MFSPKVSLQLCWSFVLYVLGSVELLLVSLENGGQSLLCRGARMLIPHMESYGLHATEESISLDPRLMLTQDCEMGSRKRSFLNCFGDCDQSDTQTDDRVSKEESRFSRVNLQSVHVTVTRDNETLLERR